MSSHKHLGVTLSRNLGWTDHIDDISLKAGKRVDILKGLKFKLSRKSLGIMYLTFIRPTMEYCSVLWDNCGELNEYKLEKTQIQAAREVSGATVATKLSDLYNEVGWDSLSARRKRSKLILFYKIVHGMTPMYLQELLPNRSQPFMREASNFRSFKARTCIFNDSFMPSATRLWNNLNRNVKELPTLAQFKGRLNKNKMKTNRLFYYGDRKLSVLHARLRLNCSSLNCHLAKIGVKDSQMCPCGAPVENTFHFLMECPLYIIHRDVMHNVVLKFAPFTTKTLLSGCDNCTYEENCMIFDAVHTYIKDTKRF